MNWLDPWLMAVPVAGLTLLLFAWWVNRFFRSVHLERARELFRLQHKRLEEAFLDAARHSGKPRGVRWAACEFGTHFELARDRQSRRLVAFVPLTVHFEAIAGGDMEGLPAVDQPKMGSAVFAFVAGEWVTTGQTVFNFAPVDAIREFARQYEPIPAGH